MSLADRVEALESQLASEEEARKALAFNADMFFLVIMAIIIYFMQCGFAFLECGAVRSKNTTNILIKNVLDSFVAGFAYWIIGYSLAFGSTEANHNSFIGTMYWAHSGLPYKLYAWWFFQMVFAATAATIVSGAMAERCDFPAYLAYSFFLTGFMYPVVTHWAWDSTGWLAVGSEGICRDCPDGINASNCLLSAEDEKGCHVGYKDFAGSGVVHLLGGCAALAGAFFLGARHGRFNEFGDPQPIRGHSVPLAALGGFILFLGFFAFNGGSQGAISNPGDGVVVARACVNTIISATFSAFVCLIANRVWAELTEGNKHWSLLQAINGALAGMVAICAGCDGVLTYSAAVIGTIAALSYMFWSWAVLKLRIDDPLDAFAVHFGGGLWGVLAAPILRYPDGIVYNWDKISFLAWGWNWAGAAAIGAWSTILAGILFWVLKWIGMLRVPKDYELNGLDIAKHGEPAYPVESYGHGWGETGDTLISMAKLMAKQSSVPLGAEQAEFIGEHLDKSAALVKARRYENAETHAHGRKIIANAFPQTDVMKPSNDYVMQPKEVVVVNEKPADKTYIQPELNEKHYRRPEPVVIYDNTDRSLDRPRVHMVPINRPMHITVSAESTPQTLRREPVGETAVVSSLERTPKETVIHSMERPAREAVVVGSLDRPAKQPTVNSLERSSKENLVVSSLEPSVKETTVVHSNERPSGETVVVNSIAKPTVESVDIVSIETPSKLEDAGHTNRAFEGDASKL